MPMIKKSFKTGVYGIENLLNGKVYIGSSSTSLEERLDRHRQLLRINRHPNRYLQAAWNKNGSGSFEFRVLQRCHPDDCLKYEQEWLDKLKSYDKRFGYNLSPKAVSVRGVVWSEESRAKLSAAKAGKKLSAESIAKRTAKILGTKRSEETKRKMSEAAKARGISQETRDKMNQSKRTEESRKAVSILHTGKKRSAKTVQANKTAQLLRFINAGERTRSALAALGNQNRRVR